MAMKSFLYILYSEIGLMIGRSSDFSRRFAVIDEYSPIELKLLRVYRIPRNRIHEKRLHRLFMAKQIRGGWFALDFNDIEEIDRYLTENGGSMILDNLGKFSLGPRHGKLDSIHDPNPNLLQEITNLEQVVEKLKATLDGRRY